ncbi:TetR/AcrR family transcriptional regulator [Burkholderia metallica]|uniref:TetR/AcrR family transcriptional regulator n=1 Tax=Burkholderia metallica TaxID=488729 RepID=UPI000D1AFF71|nr:TetR family transcriptional regulator [Burkholderia metallica]
MSSRVNTVKKNEPAKATGPRRSPRRPGAEAPADKRALILSSALGLFALRGYHGVSLRDIAQEADVPQGLIGYYFGSKLELYHELFRAHTGYIQERIASLRSVLDGVPENRRLKAMTEAFVLPVLALASTGDGADFIRMVARASNDLLAEDAPLVEEMFDPLAMVFIDAFHAVMPHAPRGTVVWCYQMALGAMQHAIVSMRTESLSRGELANGDLRSLAPILVRFITGGIRQACITL